MARRDLLAGIVAEFFSLRAREHYPEQKPGQRKRQHNAPESRPGPRVSPIRHDPIASALWIFRLVHPIRFTADGQSHAAQIGEMIFLTPGFVF